MIFNALFRVNAAVSIFKHALFATLLLAALPSHAITVTAAPHAATCTGPVGVQVVCATITVTGTGSASGKYSPILPVSTDPTLTIPAYDGGATTCDWGYNGFTGLDPNPCTYKVMYTATAAGTNSSGFFVREFDSINGGNTPGDTTTVTATGIVGPYGTLSPSATSITCPSTGVGLSSTCSATVVLTAVGGPVIFTQTPLSSSDVHFVPTGCAAGALLTSGSTCTVSSTFNPTAVTAYSTTITPNLVVGTPATFTASGNGVGGTAVAVPTLTTCPATIFGANVACGFTTVTATGGTIIFTATPFSSSDTTNFFPRTGSTCTANLSLASNATCTIASSAIPFLFAPASIGSFTDSVTINLSQGTGTSFTLTGVGTVGTLVPTPSSVSCGNATSFNAVTCGSLSLRSNGSTVVASTPYTFSDPQYTMAAGGTCAGITMVSGQTCTTGLVTFTPTANSGSIPATLSVARGDGGAALSVSITGTANAGSAAVSVVTGSTACPNTNVGTSVTCTNVKVTANTAPIQLGSTPATLSNAAAGFSLNTAGATCTPNQVLLVNATCTLGILSYNPTATGPVTTNVTVTPAAGTAGALSFTGATWGSAVATNVSGSFACPNAIANSGTSACGYAAITATGGPIQFATPAYAVSGTGASAIPLSIPGSNGTCANAQILASGTSCLIYKGANFVNFIPTVIGTVSELVTVSLSGGTGTSFTYTGTGTVGTASVQTGISCPTADTIAPSTCTSGTFLATGQVSFSSTPFSYSDPEFTNTTPGTCAGATLTNGQTCTTGTTTFAPTSNTGAKSVALTLARSDGGTNPTISFSGNAVEGATSLVAVSGTTCPTTNPGVAVSCGMVTLSVTSQTVQLGTTVVTLNATSAYTIGTSGTCTPNQLLAPGASCTIGPVIFNPPTASGSAQSVGLTVTPSTGSISAVSFSGLTWGSAVISPAGGTTCTDTVAGTGVVPATACTQATITATNGPVQFAAAAYTVTGSSAFTIGAPPISGSSSSFCTNNKLMSNGGSCIIGIGGSTIFIGFSPTALGTVSATATVNLAQGTGSGSTYTVTGTGVQGLVSSSPIGTLSCGTANQVNSSTCGPLTFTATGIVSLTSTPFTPSDPQFSVPAGTCASANLTKGQTCATGTITFAPTTNTLGVKSATLQLNRTDGTGIGNFGLSGTVGGIATTTLAPISSLACPITNPGTPVNCGAVKITATGGVLQLGSSIATLSNSTLFSFDSSGTCAPNQILNSGASCNTGNVIYTPTSSGTPSTNVTVTPAVGNSTFLTFTSTTYGTLSAATVPVSCPSTAVGASSNCTTVTLTANSGAVTLSATPFSSTNSTEFTVPVGTCTANKVLASGTTCATGTISFQPQNGGALSTSVTASVALGTSVTFNVNGTGTFGTVSLNHTALACGTMTVGGTAINCGTITLTATGGPVRLSNPLLSLNSAGANFSLSNGTCTPGALLASGTSCTTGAVTFAAVVAGVFNPTLTVSCSGTSCSPTVAISGTGLTFAYAQTAFTPAVGTSCTLALVQTRTVTCQQFDGITHTTVANSNCTGTAPVATQTVADSGGCGIASTSTLSCGAGNIGVALSCGTEIVTASGGPVTLSHVPFSGNSEFSIPAGTCADATLNTGDTCTSGAITFTPAAAGNRSTTLLLSAVTGLGSSTTFQAQGAGNGTLAINSTPTCSGNVPVGTTINCGTATLTAVGGSVSFGANPVSSNNSDFTITGGACTNATLNAGQSCATGALTFDPSIVGTDTASISITAIVGSSTSFTASGIAHLYTWISGEFTPATGSSCTASLAQTRSVTCQDDSGATVADSFCTATKPAASQTVADFSACTFSWAQSGFSTTCTGGSGSWNYSSWAPATGCGTGLTQTRTGSCVVSANSGAETQTVSCLRSDGTTVANSNCSGAGTQPAASQACTPTTFSCGTEAALSETFTDFSTCFFSWNVSAWSSGNTCSATSTETRTVSCLRSDGTTVSDAGCSGAGDKPATSQTAPDFSGCTFNWVGSGFSSCSGGSGTWNYTAWAPSTGCGASLTQTRTGSCVADAGSGTQTQTLSCQRSDGTIEDSSNCTSTAPATSQSCTPSTGFSCGTEASLTESFSDFSTCSFSWVPGAWVSQNSCSTSTTQTRTLTCTRSDGTAEDASLCTGTPPISAQTVSDLSGCTYSWNASGFGACTGGTGVWNYTSWAPATGCGTGLTQTRSGTCVANVSSGTQSQSISCQRSDGTTVSFAFCTSSAPATSQGCTPTSGTECGAEGVLSQTFTDHSTCSATWATGSFGAPSSSCSSSATETRSVTCQQSDGTVVDDSLCVGDGTKPATTETVSSLSGCTYSWSPGAWSASSNTCSSAAMQTRTVSCLQSDNSTVDASFCSSAGAAPAMSQTVADFSSCTFGWSQGGFGICMGGSGTWNYTSWSPTTGCGTTTQTRTGACAVVAASGTQNQTITCLRSDGTAVDAASCASAGSAPSASQPCSPSTDSVCGAVDILTQTVALSNGCNFSWNSGAYGACTGGTVAWMYTSWTPAVGAACTTSLNETRVGTCTPSANSGTNTRAVTCQDTNGSIVADSNCSSAGSKPATSASCTPAATGCGTEGALAQTVTDLSTCSYSWHASGFSACTGGTAAWAYSSWTPTCGIGPTTQTRSGSCNGALNSGHATQTVTCVRTDNAVVANSFCTGSAPATSQTCTPTTGCGVEAILTQKVTLVNKCQAAPVCVPSTTNTCATT